MARSAKGRSSVALVTPPDQQADRAADLARMLKLPERREPVVVKVATWIGLGIVEGRLVPGEDLNSVDLSKRFDSSRTPVREALMLLEQEGLVEIRPRRRPRVASFSPERIREIYEIRGHLLSIVGTLVAARAQDDELDDLTARVKEMRSKADADDVVGYFWDHVALQERMTEIAGNVTLKGILDSLALRTLVLRHASLSHPGRLSDSIADQELILRALRDRDGDFAATMLTRATRAALGAIENSGWASDTATDEEEPVPLEAVPSASRRRSPAG
jgi:DNA-binding GntR family transcriptional regulator